MKKEKYDVVALQECHISSQEEANIWETQWAGKLFYSLGNNHSLGQITLISKKLMENSNCVHKNDRILLTEIVLDDRKLLIANVYAPQSTTQKLQHYDEIRTIIEQHSTNDHSVIVLGDFNTVISNDLDVITGEPHNRREISGLNQMVTDLDLYDSWRVLNPENKEYTWCRNHPFTARRLDYIFVSQDLLNLTQETEISTLIHSDHRAVTTTIAFHKYKRGPSFWKLNNSLLTQATFLQHINNTIEDFKQNCDQGIDPHSKWELCKIKIREASQSYSKRQQQSKRDKMADTQNRLNTLERAISIHPKDDKLKAEMVKLKTELEVFALAQAHGAQTRSRIKYIEEGEKNTAYFLNLEKANAANNTITVIQTEDGRTVTQQAEVLNEQVKFYSHLYKKDKEECRSNDKYITDFLGSDCKPPSLEEHDIEACEREVSESDCAEAIKHMKNGSAPGSDGLTTEFYKVFWQKIKDLVIDSYRHSFTCGHVSTTQQKGIITLIHKGKDLPRENLSNWRPITLLNTDYKILAKTVALKLNNVLTKIISSDQCGFMKGRNIATILRLMDDTIQHLNKENAPGILVGIDFTKAFDTISKSFILDSLPLYGFGPEFCRKVRCLLSQSQSSINHYGWLSEPIEVERGIRQGCPLSPLLFIMAVELLAIKVRQSDIKGIALANNPIANPISNTGHQELIQTLIKIQQFADDTTLFLKDTEDLGIALEIFQNFAHISGLKINQKKTEAMWLGSDQNRHDKPYNLKWVKQIKILGIHYRSNISAREIDDNWLKKVENMKRIIKQWSRRNLSIFGKILVAKTFIISQFIFIMQAVGLPEDTLNEINRTLFSFLWKKKYSNKKAFEKVKRKILTQGFEQGGLKMIDMKTLQDALYLTWLPRLLSTEHNAAWKVVPISLFSHLGKELNILTHTCSPDDLKGIPRNAGLFWPTVLKKWLEVKMNKHTPADHNIYLDTPLWNNGKLKYKNNVLHLKDWIRCGIHTVEDVLTVNNEVRSYQEIVTAVGQSPCRMLEYNAVKTVLLQATQRNRLHHSYLHEEISYLTISDKPLITMTCRDWRKLLTEDTQPCAVNFWHRKLDVKINQTHWEAVFKATKETRLRVLQWKILHNIYPTNILLNKMGIANSNKCNACTADEIDYIEHFFFSCAKIHTVWKIVEKEINTRIGSHIPISKSIALLGYHDDSSHTAKERATINWLITLAKMCISKYRYGDNIRIDLIFEKELRLRDSDPTSHIPQTITQALQGNIQ